MHNIAISPLLNEAWNGVSLTTHQESAWSSAVFQETTWLVPGAGLPYGELTALDEIEGSTNFGLIPANASHGDQSGDYSEPGQYFSCLPSRDSD